MGHRYSSQTPDAVFPQSSLAYDWLGAQAVPITTPMTSPGKVVLVIGTKKTHKTKQKKKFICIVQKAVPHYPQRVFHIAPAGIPHSPDLQEMY